MKIDEFLRSLAESLTFELTANSAIRRFTNNSALIGAFAEATVRQFVRRVVSPLRVSHGAIIYEDNCGTGDHSQPPEMDSIVWAPSFVPAIFEVGDFAFVPRGSALAVLEIKSTNYSGAAERIQKSIEASDPLLHYAGELPGMADGVQRALGVVCMRNIPNDDILDALIQSDRAVALLTVTADGKVESNAGAIYKLLKFLVCTRRRGKVVDGQMYVPYEDLAKL